ncbi:hypothetical protein EGX98_10995 [Fusobacterium necrophorum]|uniref:Uncharacterized protein n=1 Tax=Fusobacterium necrophorum BL TaxID=1441732 RepID=A0AB73BVV6_9FUSO|nr:hypothetical protein [Fusobacterium necrophorum]AYZ74506.1 hypothetical protein EGX98_10995 [Fusobacterium necrophorum]AZW09611.1 hypothetical protein EO219_08585 [Fusobacterium necrophorum subsp. necrophorum]KDE62716.1 hypothetical protein FUSO3_07110 [Fusobacterium necrophorum BL]MBR8733461.1 hypothetical protein [Fusobacterium necrophorum]MBR8789638.1 hypothetical protein [Fusobacterium necrophorum]
MNLQEHGFYIIKNDFFTVTNQSNIPLQKNGRPIYFCIKDAKNSDIFWIIPLTTKIQKVEKAFKKMGGENNCPFYVRFPKNFQEYNISAFNIGDAFPITAKYIEREFTKRGQPYVLKDVKLIQKIENKVLQTIKLKMTNDKINSRGIDVRKIYQQLLDELKNERAIKQNPLITKILAKRENKEKITKLEK